MTTFISIPTSSSFPDSIASSHLSSSLLVPLSFPLLLFGIFFFVVTFEEDVATHPAELKLVILVDFSRTFSILYINEIINVMFLNILSSWLYKT